MPALAEGHDRFARFHAWQGGALVGLLWLGLILIGLLGRASDGEGFQTFIGVVSLFWLMAGFTGIGFGIAGAARGLHNRVRPVYDVLALFGR